MIRHPCFSLAALLFLAAVVTLPTGADTALVSPLFFPVVGKGGETAGKGIVLNGGAFHCEDAAAVGATWQHTGGTQAGVDCAGIEDVPRVDLSDIGGALGGDSVYLLTVNEPDLWHSIDQVVIWQRAIEDAYPGWRIVAPDMSHLAGNYLADVRAAYIARYGVAPRWYALAAHCYSTGQMDCIAVLAPYTDLARQWRIPGGVWVTEYAALACGGWSQTAARAEAARVVAWLRANATRWAWFNSRTDGGEVWSFKPTECNAPVVTYQLGYLTGWGEFVAGQ